MATETSNNFRMKERFEFILTINDNIICQRYFKINNLNEESLCSLNIKDAIDICVDMIHNDLVSKSRVYLAMTSPYIFNNEAEYTKSKTNFKNGDIIYLKSDSSDYTWFDEKLFKCPNKPESPEYMDEIVPWESTFKFSFLDNGREIVSKIWDGSVYPKTIKNGVDLSNKKGKFDKNYLLQLNTENTLLYHMVNDKQDLVFQMIRVICDTCILNNKKNIITYVSYGNKEYNLNLKK